VSNISHYANFNISGFQIFDPVLSSKEGLFPIQDTDCATSSPNALLGYRTTTGPWPRLMLNPGNQSYFHLQSISLKALGYVPKGLVVSLNGFEVTDGRIVTAYSAFLMYLREGYQKVLVFDFAKFGWWPERINALEFWAEFEGKKDWQFCVDDLNVVFEES
jgi:hypothetical protein